MSQYTPRDAYWQVQSPTRYLSRLVYGMTCTKGRLGGGFPIHGDGKIDVVERFPKNCELLAEPVVFYLKTAWILHVHILLTLYMCLI